MDAPDKWSTLAGLRFLLASIVAVNHLAAYAPLGFLSFVPKLGAFEAILGFLLISGYSVSVSYLKEPEHFFLRRLRRIYPVYVASIAFTLFVNFFCARQTPTVGNLFLNLLLLNQLFTTSSLVGPAWSLSLECWLYGLAPTLLNVRPAWNRRLVYLSFGSFLVYTACRTRFHLPYYSAVGCGANLILLSFVWICGLRLARDQDRARVLWDVRLIFVVHLAFDASIQLASRLKHHAVSGFFYEDAPGFALQAVTLWVVYALFTVCVLPPRPSPRRSRLLRFLGDVSYPLYLIHLPVYLLLLVGTPLRSPFFYYLIAFVASAALYWSIDSYSKRRHLQLQSA